jgi:hypothetical protein
MNGLKRINFPHLANPLARFKGIAPRRVSTRSASRDFASEATRIARAATP